MIEFVDKTDVMLVFVCFLVSLISPSIGTSGGVTFAVMATVMPPTVVVPIHGLIEGVASAMRWTLLRQFVNYRYLLFFTIGTILGLLAGWPILGRIPDDVLRIVLGLFFLLSVWAPVSRLRSSPAVGGALTSALSVLVGATGPLVAALISRHEKDHRAVIGTQGACTTFQHLGKALLFGIWGFSFVDYIGLIAAMIGVTIIGTIIGKRILLNSSQKILRLALNTVVTLLGVQLLLDGFNVELDQIPIGSWLGAVLVTLVVGIGCQVAYRLGASQNQASHGQEKGRDIGVCINSVKIRNSQLFGIK